MRIGLAREGYAEKTWKALEASTTVRLSENSTIVAPLTNNIEGMPDSRLPRACGARFIYGVMWQRRYAPLPHHTIYPRRGSHTARACNVCLKYFVLNKISKKHFIQNKIFLLLGSAERAQGG